MTSTLYKITNQIPAYRFNSGDPKPTCSKCSKLISRPFTSTVFNTSSTTGRHSIMYNICHYIGTSHFIIESKSGRASTYCSEYCMKKHNAIFTRKK